MLGESPYIGKARHKRNTFPSDSVDTADRHLATGGLVHTDRLEEDESRQDLARGTDIHIVAVVLFILHELITTSIHSLCTEQYVL